MRVYVASAFGNRAQASAAMEILSGLGHEVTHDWTGGAESASAAELGQAASDDLQGIARADVLIFIAHTAARGALVEMGFAIARGIPVIIVCPGDCGNIFNYLPAPAVRWAPHVTAAVQMIGRAT